MEFRTLSMLRQPPEKVWEIMRDRMHETAAGVEDVESVEAKFRREDEPGRVRTLYHWTSAPRLPALLQNQLQPGMLSWEDSALWDDARQVCDWRIRSDYFQDKMICHGTTTFAPAMGGRGCRLTFEGTIQWTDHTLPGIGRLQGPVLKLLEGVLAKMIPNNFQRVAKAVEQIAGDESPA